MHLCTWVSEERGDGERADSEALSLLSYTLRYVSLTSCHGLGQSVSFPEFVYYESLKRELKTKNYIWISV